MAMSCCLVAADVGVSVGCLALEYFTVQRASLSFRASLAGLSCYASGISPAFSSWLLCVSIRRRPQGL